MGAALASHDLSDPQLQQLLSEYVDHSRKTADECAHIFRGSLGMYDDEQNDLPPASLGTRRPAYPRHIQLAQFEEVFGMLVADPGPHFRFFHNGKIVAADANPKPEATVDFVLRLYADIAGVLTPEAKSSLIKDFFTSVEEVLQLADSIPGSIITSVERAFWSDEPEKLMTVVELYEVCLTHPNISGMLHGVQALTEEFSAARRQEKLRQREINAQAQQISMRHGGDNNSARLKAIARTISSAALPSFSLLWDLKAGDYENFWQKPEPLRIRASETCVRALEKMATADAQSALIVDMTDTEACQLLGLISIDKLLLYFLHCLVPEFQSPTAKSYEYTRARAQEAIKQFGGTPLRDVTRFFFTERTPLLGTIRDDEAFFSVLLRFACGESSMAVSQNYSSCPEAVLGCLTVYDMLVWLDEDMTLLKGKERCAVAAFPEFFYAPATIGPVSACASMCEGLVEMVSRKLSGTLVETGKDNEKRILSPNTFRDLFPASFSCLSEKDGEPGPLLRAVAANAAVLPLACVVPPDTSIAKVIREMIDKRANRVIIQRQDGLIVGAVRASDIFVMLLRAQHTSLR